MVSYLNPRTESSHINAPYSNDPLFTSITCLVSACCFQTSDLNLAGEPSVSQTTLLSFEEAVYPGRN